MHIALIGTRGVPAKYGGFETCAEEISTRISSMGHKVTVYCRNGNYDDSLKNYKGVKLVHLPTIKGKLTETFFHTFISLVHSLFLKPDVYLIMNAANAPLCIFLKFLRKKVIINVDGLEWRRKKWGIIGKSYYLFSEWVSSKIATRIVSDALGIKDYYLKRYKTNSTFIAYGAKIEKSSDKNILSKYNLEPDEYLFIASRLEPENNADIAVNAMQYLNTKKKLVIAGGANYKSQYIKSLNRIKDNRIIFLGPIYTNGHIKELHCNCFAYIHGNEVGGTNPALLKAMGYGNMVFASNNVFNTEVLDDCGIIFDKDPKHLSDKLKVILENPEKRTHYQKKAIQRIKKKYTWEKIAQQYLELFIDCTDGKY